MNYWIGLAALVVFVFPSLFVMLAKNDASHPQPVAQTQLLPEADEPLPKSPSPERSTPAVTALVTRAQRTSAAARVKSWSNHAANQMFELVDGPIKSLFTTAPSTAPAKSIVADTEKPGATSPSPELAATPDNFVSDAVNTENEHLQPIAKRPAEFRTWVDDTGQYRIVARFVSVRDGTVRLFKENGRVVSVPLDRLGADDQRYIQRWLQLTE